MAQIALPRQQATQPPPADIGSPLYQRRRISNAGPIELIPNPDFTFPQRPPEAAYTEPRSATDARSMSHPTNATVYPAGRRGSAPGPRQKSVSALPNFSFNPSRELGAPNVVTTPPHSPMTVPDTPSRPVGGHRRGGSEFIGGDGRTGGSTLLSSSPTKGNGVLPPPSANLRPGPPAGRRGHAHRRSGAISSHDLSAIMRPADAPPRAGSAPVTPLEGEQFVFGHAVNKSISQPSLRHGGLFPEDDTTQRPPSRARVGFADKVEYIRPLSTISSETETSMSTVRGHSATNSLSSVISLGTSTPSPGRMSRSSANVTKETEGRPKTAGAVLDLTAQQNAKLSGELSSRKRPMSAVSPGSPSTVTGPASPRLPMKRRGFFRLESRKSDSSITTLPTSASDPALSAPLESPIPSPMMEDGELFGDFEKPKDGSRKSGRTPRKVKSWANAIIPRKGKQTGKVKGRAPTPPPDTVPDMDDSESEELDFEANFDVDNTVTIVSRSDSAARTRKVDADIASWRPRELKRVDSDTASPVIDLDAALGPFNTPNDSSPRTQQRGFGAHRRAMHSSGALLLNHRRTESAPALVPFELRSSAVGTTTTMADVFEEEEPEDDSMIAEKTLGTPVSLEKHTDEDDQALKIQLVEAESDTHDSEINWNFDGGLGIKRHNEDTPAGASEHLVARPIAGRMPSHNGSMQSLEPEPVEVVEDFEEPRTSSLTHSSDSTVTPQISSDEAKEPQTVMNLHLPLGQQSLMTPDTFTSSFSSPDFRSSQASLDTPRLGTAASSVTDYRAMPSPRFGEPGPELRISVDDVPSLTSSRSTMTSAMHNVYPMMSPRRPSERSTSLSSIPSEGEQRRRKRSSIASLSRLINSSSHGERSKLNIEQRPHSEYLEPSKESKKKHKRLSKLMFWKPKDGERS